MPNFGVLDPQRKNIGGELYRNELLALANGKADADMRAMAIASLGLVRDPAFEMSLDRWLAIPHPPFVTRPRFCWLTSPTWPRTTGSRSWRTTVPGGTQCRRNIHRLGARARKSGHPRETAQRSRRQSPPNRRHEFALLFAEEQSHRCHFQR